MVRISVIAHSAAYGNAAVLAEGLKSFAEVTTSFFIKDEKEMFPSKVNKTIHEADHYVVVGAISLGHLPKKYWSKGVTIILTDSKYMNDYKRYNEIFKANSFKVFAMPDLASLAETESIYYQPFIMPDVSLVKTELICHSPYHPQKMIQKGTAFISAVCAKNNLPLEIITGKKWKETIEIKARHLIFIDQIFRGIGKSGLEAMLLNCAVLSGEKPDCNYLPPIMWTDKKRLEDDLLSLIFDKQLTKLIVEKQRAWAKVNLDAEFVAQRIYENR
jgi:hypothetical protein